MRHLRNCCSGNYGKGLPPEILPADSGLTVHLPTLQILCSLQRAWAPIEQTRTMRQSEPFGALSYLSSECWL
jgi:hypothetical protein